MGAGAKAEQPKEASAKQHKPTAIKILRIKHL
jgi:hypothetical protein